ncbi:MAG: zeta toxin family protein [Gemmataceae bacterium]|nr:zeta toxin family protein [Gemmataceae bacterium]
MDAPNVIILAGPNGAGKSTISNSLIRRQFGCAHYVNADTIARGLSAFSVEAMAVKAGRIMLQHLHDLADAKESFAFETTLASKTFAPWIAELKTHGYRFHLIYLWLQSPEVAMKRVSFRVAEGGHDIPIDVIRRRYQRGVENFFRLYRPLADAWKLFDHSDPNQSRLIAEMNDTIEVVHDQALWESIAAGVVP